MFPFLIQGLIYKFFFKKKITANGIVWKESAEIVADGVEVAAVDRTLGTLKAKKGVVVSAGILRNW